jgi:hypothetical protein
MGCVAAFLLAAWAFVIALFVGTFGLVPELHGRASACRRAWPSDLPALRACGVLAPAVKGSDRWQRMGGIGLGAVTLLISGTLMAIPNAYRERLARRAQDQTCQSVLRDRESISPQVGLVLSSRARKGAKLTQIMEDLAAVHELQFGSVASEPARSLVRLCNDRLTIKVSVHGIEVFELQPHSGWQQPTKDLIGRIETVWPGKLRFHSPEGGEMPRPKELL